MNKFRRNNTEGYSPAALAALNRAWNSLAPHLPEDDGDDLGVKAYLDHIAAQMLARYDSGCRGDSLVADILS